MLIGNFDKSLVCSEAVAPLFKNAHFKSFFACITKPIVINVEPLFLIRGNEASFPTCLNWEFFGESELIENQEGDFVTYIGLFYNNKQKYHSTCKLVEI